MTVKKIGIIGISMLVVFAWVNSVHATLDLSVRWVVEGIGAISPETGLAQDTGTGGTGSLTILDAIAGDGFIDFEYELEILDTGGKEDLVVEIENPRGGELILDNTPPGWFVLETPTMAFPTWGKGDFFASTVRLGTRAQALPGGTPITIASLSAEGFKFFTTSEKVILDVAVPVPEPTSLLLFSAGLVGIVLFGRKRKQSNAV